LKTLGPIGPRAVGERVNKGTDIVSLFAVDGLKCCSIRALKKLAELKGAGDESPFTLDN
jgi:hypothetical protein